MSTKGLRTVSTSSTARQAREQARRESDILAVARDLLYREGTAGFSMERVAEDAGYSRTAVYHYFECKEELVIALAIQTAELRLELHRRVEQFAARPRERIVALGEVTAVLFPMHVMPEMVAYANTLRMKTSEGRQERLRSLDRQAYCLGLDIVKEAVDCGDLEVPAGVELAELRFSLDAFTRGSFISIATAMSAEDLGIVDPRTPLRKLGARFLDGLRWKPLSTEWDYRETMRRIYSDVFPSLFLASLGLVAPGDGCARRR